MKKTHQYVMAAGLLAATLILLSGRSFSRGHDNEHGPTSFYELLAVGDRVVVSYIAETVQLTIVRDEAFWQWAGEQHLPLQRGVVIGTSSDYVQVRIEPGVRGLTLPGIAVIAHFPYWAIDAINVHVHP